MTLITLSDKEYQRLVEVVHTAHDPRALQRAQALLWLSAGEDATEVAQRLFVTPRTVYRWVHRFHQRPHLAMRARLGDSPRGGRPRLAGGVIDTLIARVLAEDPWEMGDRSTVWTAALLRQYLRDVPWIEVSQRRVSRALERLGIVWKRLRDDLARRSSTWRQAKGGSNVA
jgi:transposase